METVSIQKDPFGQFYCTNQRCFVFAQDKYSKITGSSTIEQNSFGHWDLVNHKHHAQAESKHNAVSQSRLGTKIYNLWERFLVSLSLLVVIKTSTNSV